MRRADFSVQLDRRKPACVLDPALVLAHASGPALAHRLVAVFEPWLTRSFWQTLDASELLLMNGTTATSRVNLGALNRWLALRENTDSSAWVMRWVGDRLAESHLADGADSGALERYEHLLAGLQTRALSAAADDTTHYPWCGFDAAQASLDALALSATLEGALLLCAGSSERLPPPVALAQRLGLQLMSAQAWTPTSLFPAERDFVRAALAAAGLATLTHGLPPLAVAHVCVDEDNTGFADAAGETDATAGTGESGAASGAGGAGLDEWSESVPDPWAHARVWWYPL
jgi:hypothetical protein